MNVISFFYLFIEDGNYIMNVTSLQYL